MLLVTFIADRSGNSGAVMVINQKSDIVDALTSLSFGVPGIIAVVGVKYMTRYYFRFNYTS